MGVEVFSRMEEREKKVDITNEILVSFFRFNRFFFEVFKFRKS